MGSFPSSILAGLPELNVPAQWKTLYFLFPPLLFSKSLHCFLKLQSDPKFPITGFCFGSPDLSLYTLDEQPRLFPHHLSPSHFLSSQHIKLILSWEYEENGPISPILNPVSPSSSQIRPSFQVPLNVHEAHFDSINLYLFPWHLEGYFIILWTRTNKIQY